MANHLLAMLFGSELTQVVKYQKNFDVRVAPCELLRELGSVQGRAKFERYMKGSRGSNQRIRILAVAGLVVLHSSDFYELIEESLLQEDGQDTWVSRQIANPFALWLKRCCETAPQFQHIKNFHYQNSTLMHRIPYVLNLLQSLLKVVSLIPKFGRYFDLETGNQVYILLSEVLLSLVNLMYSHLKKSLEKYLLEEEEDEVAKFKDILKWIYGQAVPEMNETIRNVTLNRHFRFYQKGIVTKLITPKEYTPRLAQLINSFLKENDGQEELDERQEELSSLESQIFPEDGSFNEDLFLSSLSLKSAFSELTNIRQSGQAKVEAGRWGKLKQNRSL